MNRTTSQSEKFKVYVQQRMEEGCFNAVVIYDELKAQSYTGSITTLRYFMRSILPTLEAKTTVRYETPPGEQAQVEWEHFRVDWKGKAVKLNAFIMVLGYSRQMHLEVTDSFSQICTKIQLFIKLHQRYLNSVKMIAHRKTINLAAPIIMKFLTASPKVVALDGFATN